MIKKSLSMVLALAMMLCMLPTAMAETTHNCGKADDCLVCFVAEGINNLPDVEDITVDNAAEVMDAIHAIDRVKFDLTDEQYKELLTMVETAEDVSGGGMLVPARYATTLEKVVSLGGVPFIVEKKFSVAEGNTLNYDNAKVEIEITNVDTNATQTLTMSYMDGRMGTLSGDADFYSADNDGFSFTYILPAGTYTVREVGESDVMLNGAETVATTVTYNGSESEGVTVSTDEGTVTVYNHYEPIEPALTSTVDAGFYAESSKASKREGVIAFTTGITNYRAIENTLDSFGYNITFNGTTVTIDSYEIPALINEGGYFNVVISNIPKEYLDTEFIATGYVESLGKTYMSETVTTSVSDINKWLGEKN